MIRYFHGGKPGLEPGDLIEPGAPNYLDNCPICQAVKAGRSTPYEQPSQNPDRVYVTSDKPYARFYASKYPRGGLYVVEPLGELVESTEDRFPTWHCPSARVLTVYDRCVELTPSQRRVLFRRWTVADRHAAQVLAVPADT
jgi:hypothetical protein